MSNDALEFIAEWRTKLCVAMPDSLEQVNLLCDMAVNAALTAQAAQQESKRMQPEGLGIPSIPMSKVPGPVGSSSPEAAASHVDTAQGPQQAQTDQLRGQQTSLVAGDSGASPAPLHHTAQQGQKPFGFGWIDIDGEKVFSPTPVANQGIPNVRPLYTTPPSASSAMLRAAVCPDCGGTEWADFYRSTSVIGMVCKNEDCNTLIDIDKFDALRSAPADVVAVPVEPTYVMLAAASTHFAVEPNRLRQIWKAMIAAARGMK